MPKLSRVLRSRISAVLIAACFGASAQAQEAQRPALEEVIVTAQKREQRLLDVPASVHVVGAEEIDRRNIVGAADYLRGVPGANQVDSPYGQAIVIRGIESSPAGQNFWSGGTVATYFGETPTSSSEGLGGSTNIDIKLVDIQRVEVLRGPQGTAFGSSSMGGAVRTIPVRPRLDEFEGEVSAGYSVTSGTGGDNYEVNAIANLPLARDRFALRAVAYVYDDNGYYTNVAGSNEAFRAAAVTPYNAEAFAIDQKEVGDRYVQGGRVSALWQATEDLSFSFGYLSQENEFDGFAMARSGSYEQTLLQVAPQHELRGHSSGGFDSEIEIATAQLDYAFDWGNLIAVYSHTESGSILAAPFTSFDLDWPVSYTGDSEHTEDVAEIRLTTRLDGAWNFLVGLYAEELDDEAVYNYFFHGDPATNFFGPDQLLGIYPDQRTLEQKALFGEFTWEFTPNMSFTGGARTYEFDRTYEVNATPGAFYGPDGIVVSEETDASGTNYRANLSYRPSDSSLVYAAFSQGFRLGQLQSGLPPGVCDLDGDGIVDGSNGVTIEETRQVNSDEVDSYDIGTKFELLERRLAVTLDVFRMEWSGIPVTVTAAGDLGDGCGLGYLANAGDATSEGVEFQSNYVINEAVQMYLGASWIDARLTEDVPALGAERGNQLPGAPEFNANFGIQYEFGLGQYESFVRADAIYVGEFYGDLLQTEGIRSGDYLKVNLSGRVQLQRMNVDVYVDNLTDEDAFTFRGISPVGSQFYGYQLRPRTVGLRIGYQF